MRECFHTSGPGRPPRKPLGLFRAFLIMRMKGVRSLREIARLLNVDPMFRKLCLIEEGERGYPRSAVRNFLLIP
ncbi:MAG: transposase [Candidatus Freyarchaeota archaeon]